MSAKRSRSKTVLRCRCWSIKKSPRDAEFDEVKAQMIEVVKLEKARGQVEEIAKQIASGATSVAALGSRSPVKEPEGA